MPKVAPPKETNVTRGIITNLNKIPGCHARKVFGGPYGTRGEPDIDACIRGRTVKIEVKSPGAKRGATPTQELAMERWRRAGAVVMVATSWTQVEDRLRAEGLLGIDCTGGL